MTLEDIYKIPQWEDAGRIICKYNKKQIRRSHLVAIYIMGLIWDSSKEVIHHKDFNSFNDSPDNLQLITRGEHTILHKTGSKLSGETKEKISNSLKGNKLSEETKIKIGESQKGEKHHMYGKHHSEETRKKISESNKGKKGNLGYKHTEEAKEKNRLSHLGKKLTEETKKKLSAAKIGNTNALGHKHTEEHKRKIGLSVTGEKNGFYGKHHTEETKEKMKLSWLKKKGERDEQVK